MKYGIRKLIEARLTDNSEKDVFVVGDFVDIAEPKSASKVLNRLCDEGKIKKLMRGVFSKRVGADDTDDPDEVAHALARENSWTLVPCGATALHLIGLSKDEPEEWTYISDGTYRNYTWKDKKISFTHTTVKAFRNMSEKTALLVQVIRAYGEEHLSEENLKSILAFFKPSEQAKILSEAKYAPAWIYRTVKKMFSLAPTAENK